MSQKTLLAKQSMSARLNQSVDIFLNTNDALLDLVVYFLGFGFEVKIWNNSDWKLDFLFKTNHLKIG